MLPATFGDYLYILYKFRICQYPITGIFSACPPENRQGCSGFHGFGEWQENHEGVEVPPHNPVQCGQLGINWTNCDVGSCGSPRWASRSRSACLPPGKRPGRFWMIRNCQQHPMPWHGVAGAIPRCQSVSTAFGRVILENQGDQDVQDHRSVIVSWCSAPAGRE
jgi:hypothetical protein